MTSSTPTGRPSAPRASAPASDCRSPRASSRRFEDSFGWRASRGSGRRHALYYRWSARPPPSLRPRLYLQRSRHAELREEPDEPPPFLVRGGVDAAEVLDLLAVFAARDGEAGRGLLREKDAAPLPRAVLEAIAEERGVEAAHGFVAVDRGRGLHATAAAPRVERADDELGEHVAQAVAAVADRGEEAQARLRFAGAHDAALYRDAGVVPREVQLCVLVAERRVVQHARAEDADLDDRHGRGAERRGNRRIEEKALELAPLVVHAPIVRRLLRDRAHPRRRAEPVADLLPVLRRVPRHALHVVDRLAERRDAAEALDPSLAGVVRGERHALVAEAVEKLLQVLRSGGDVRLGIERILAAEDAARLRDDLHQPLRGLVRDEARAEIRLRLHDRGDELRRQAVAPRLAVDDRAVRNLAAEELLLHRLERHRHGGVVGEEGVAQR